MKKFINHFKKYNNYILYATKAELKSEISSSYLTWLWWLLDPLFFMLIYTFIVQIVFKTSVENLPIFVLSGLLIWNFFNKNIITSVKIVNANKSIITQRYIPKFMLVIQKIYVNFFKFLISLFLLIIMMLIFKININVTVIYSIPLLMLLIIFSFALATIISHFGVFIDDLSNVVQITLRLLFYLSGIFYSIEDHIPVYYANLMLKINPIAYIIQSFRDVVLYQTPISIQDYLYWFIITIILSIIAVKLVYKYENTYAKVM